MTRTKSTYLALLAVLLSPMAANADLIEYDFVGDASPNGWTMAGSILLDEADVIAGVNLVNFFDSWEFSWTNGAQSFSSSSVDSIIQAGRTFFVNSLLAVSSVNLCSDSCSSASHPEFFVNIGSGSGFWQGTTSTSRLEEGSTGSWSGPSTVSVPEPGTLALLGIGLLGMGLSRRKKV